MIVLTICRLNKIVWWIVRYVRYVRMVEKLNFMRRGPEVVLKCAFFKNHRQCVSYRSVVILSRICTRRRRPSFCLDFSLPVVVFDAIIFIQSELRKKEQWGIIGIIIYHYIVYYYYSLIIIIYIIL